MSCFGEDVRKLGFGLMRLPNENGVFDIEQIKMMVDEFLAAGFTYFDTAYVYDGSEDAIRQALVERHPRESYTLATKMAAWSGAKTREAAEKQLETSLQRTGAGYFDFYLLHNLGEDRTHYFDDFDLWNFVQKKKAEGVIRHVGFSFHDSAEKLDKVLKAHPEVEFVQLQINYSDWDDPIVQSRLCYETVRRHGKSLVIMEPVKGGLLATPPQGVVDAFKAAEPESSPASWGIRFAADLDGVITVLSGMSTIEQMRDNLKTMKDFKHLSDSQKAVLLQAQEEIKKVPLVQCTSCRYCEKACPNSIGVSGTIKALNTVTLFGNRTVAVDSLTWNVDGKGQKRAAECLQCGACEAVCPQHLPIRELMQRGAAL